MQSKHAILTILMLIAWTVGPQSAGAYTRRIYDCSKPTASNTCWHTLDPSHASYPVQYTPYIFGRTEGEPPRGPNPVPGENFGSVDVDLAYDLVEQSHQYYLEKFGRNGPNSQGGMGNGSSYPVDRYQILVNYNGTNPLTCANQDAVFRWPEVDIRFCCGAVNLDIFGHEMNHAVGYYEGWIGDNFHDRNEHGALAEGMADAFGQFFEAYMIGTTDWAMTNSSNVVIRNIANPGGLPYIIEGVSTPQPDRYLSPNFYTGEVDDGGEHINSTVLSHAAYLAAEGGSFNGFDMAGIGIAKLEQILYRTETEYFTWTDDFNSAYTDIIQAATDLYGPEDVWEVTKALRAAELNMSRSFNGDFNNDGLIDAADYTVWRDGLGSTWSLASIDVWKNNFGQVPGSGSVASVPEPADLTMLGPIFAALAWVNRRQRLHLACAIRFPNWSPGNSK